MTKHKKTKKRPAKKSRHHRLVGGVLAAALAFTVVVGSQLGDFDGGQLQADFMCNGAMVPDGTACQPAGGGYTGGSDPSAACTSSGGTWNGSMCTMPGQTSGGTVSNISCNALNGASVTAAVCDDADHRKAACAAPSVWNGSNGGTCTAGTATGTQTGTQTGSTGGTASQYVTQPTCSGAAYFWSTMVNRCFSTQAEKSAAEGGGTQSTGTYTGGTNTGGSYPAGTCANGTAYPAGSGYPPCGTATGTQTGTQTGTVDTVGACQGRGGTWTAATSTCSVGSTQTGTNTGTGMTTAQMQAGCVAANGTWDSTRNFCQMPSGMQGTGTYGTQGSGMYGTQGTGTYGTQGFGMYGDSSSTRTFWCMSLGKMATATECDAGDAASGFRPMTQPFNPGMMQKCEQGQYYDFASQACKQARNFDNFDTSEHFDVFQGEFQCPEWDTYCQEKMEGGIGEEGFGFEQDFGEVRCLENPKDIARMQKEIARDVSQIEKRFQEVDLSQLSDSYLTAEIKTSFDEMKTLSKSTDGCDVAKAGEYRGKFFGGPEGEGYMRQLDGVGELSRFRKELGRISQEIAKEKTRMKGAEALAYLTEAETLVAKIGANPSFDPEQPWTLWDQLAPECMRGGPPMGGQGGRGPGMGMPNFECTDSELKGTVRGLMMLARKSADTGRHESFEGGICEGAEKGIAEAEEFMIPQLPKTAQAEAAKLIATGKQAVEKCKTDKDKFKYAKVFEKMQQSFMALVEKSGVDFEDFGGGEGEGEFNMDEFNFSNTDDLVGSDIMDKINALLEAKVAELEAKFEEKLNNVQRLFEEKLTQMATVFSQTVIDSLASVIDVLDEDVANSLAAVTEFSTFITDEDAQGIANTKIEATIQVIEQTETIEQFAIAEDNEDLVDLVAEVQEKLAEDPLPLEVVYEVQDVIESALTIAENGGDPADKLEEAVKVIDGVSQEELHDALLLSGEWAIADVAPDANVWYAREFADAMSKGVLGGTPTEVEIDGEVVEATNMRPGVPLNNAEGVAMAIKTYNSATGEDLPEPSADAIKMAGGAEWAAPFIQEYIDIAGKGDAEDLFASGASAEMNREDVAIMMTELYEDVAGPVDVTPEETYENAWSDAGSIDGATAEHAFAVQYELGVLTGGNGGTVGQADLTITRDQAAKVFSVGFDRIEEAGILGEGGFEFIGGPEPTLEQ